MNWYLKVLKQFADFNGRARRKEYWMFFLFNVIFAVVASQLDSLLGINFIAGLYGPIYLVYALVMLVPGLAVAVRRLHDIGKSGWMLLVALIPLVGSIWLLVLLASNGNQGDNAYGADPKASEAA